MGDPHTQVTVSDSIVPLAVMAGAVIVLLALVSGIMSFVKRKSGAYSFWLGIIFYALLVDGATTVGRSAFPIAEALATRYSTFSGLAVIGIYGILTCLASENRARPIDALWGYLFGLIVSGLVLSTIKGFETAAEEKLAKEYRIFVLSSADTQPDFVLRGRTDSPEPREGGVALLKKYGWNIFAPGGPAERYAVPSASLPALAAPAQLSPPELMKERDYLVVRGCALNTEGNDVIGGVFLDIDGTLYPTFYGVPRPEVVQALKQGTENRLRDAEAKAQKEAAERGLSTRHVSQAEIELARRNLQALNSGRLDCCGYERAFPAGFPGKGHHRLTVKVLTKDRGAFYAAGPAADFDVE